MPIIVECFEIEGLEAFSKFSDLPLVYLMFYNNPMVTYNMTNVTKIAHGVGPKSDWLFKYMNETWNLTAPSKFIEECHSLGLSVHPYTIQDDMLRWTKTPLDEHEVYINKQVDGIFTEFPHLTAAAFNKFKSLNHFPDTTSIEDNIRKLRYKAFYPL